MRRRALLASAFPLTLALGGCGFHPLYGQASGGHALQQMQTIAVGIIPNRAGQLLRQALQARLDTRSGVPKRYTLSVSYTLASEGIGIQPDSTSTRVRVIGTATWTLRDTDPQHTQVAGGVARDMDGLNVIENQYFASDMENEVVQGRIANALADRITLQIATFFERQARHAPKPPGHT